MKFEIWRIFASKRGKFGNGSAKSGHRQRSKFLHRQVVQISAGDWASGPAGGLISAAGHRQGRDVLFQVPDFSGFCWILLDFAGF